MYVILYDNEEGSFCFFVFTLYRSVALDVT